MNAPGAHYVANAGAKIQLFSVTAIAFAHFFASGTHYTAHYTAQSSLSIN